MYSTEFGRIDTTLMSTNNLFSFIDAARGAKMRNLK